MNNKAPCGKCWLDTDSAFPGACERCTRTTVRPDRVFYDWKPDSYKPSKTVTKPQHTKQR